MGSWKKAVVLIAMGVPAACGWGDVITLGHTEATGGQVATGGVSTGETGGSAAFGGATGGTGTGGTGSGEAGAAGAGGARVQLVATQVLSLGPVNTDNTEDNPTLTADELLLCFTSKRSSSSGGTDIWCSERASRENAFDEPIELTELNTEGFDASPALSLDGLSLWFGSEVDGQLDVFVAQRPDRLSPWGERETQDSLNSQQDDIPRPPAMAGLVMPLASRRGGDVYWTYLAERPDAKSAFGTPTLITELATEGTTVVDAFLREDGLLLLFNSKAGDDPGDLYTSFRPNLDAPFGEPTPILGVNSAGDERDPWLSPDGRRLYFSSDRDGTLDMFVAELE